MTIDALGKSDSIQNLKIADLRYLLFDSSVDPALLAGEDDDDEENDEHTSLPGVHDKDTESDHNSIDPNEADNKTSKASIHSTGSHISVHSATSEPPQHPPDEEDNLSQDQTESVDVEIPELETQVPVLHQSERVSVPPSDYIPQMGSKTYVMNI